ncbi:uncharacterized protein LOC131146788 [Malania oleifera]|uniref:uncharacterized protein LOC131146788 n=1 Tax=Malania oleifera TaxID=397392 RepID=UPI0025ADFE2A|nr:uncharacterized protein LOC131146788 [Malania oleifera]
MPAIAETSTIAEHIRLRKPKNHSIIKTDPNPHIPSIVQSTRCKSSISSLLLSPFSNTIPNENPPNTHNSSNNNGSINSTSGSKKKNFSSASFRGLGCAASAQASLPEVIRTKADWQAKKARKKKQRSLERKRVNSSKTHDQAAPMADNPSSSVVVPDIWCAPGIGFAADAPSVDCVESRRPVSGRGKIDGDKMNPRERSSCNARRTANPEHIPLLDPDSAFGRMHPGSDIFGARYYRHVRHHSPEGLAEIMLFQSSLLIGGRSDVHDRYREWRLDVDNMSYEELLELGDRIGYVSTGLREDEIGRCLRKTKLSILEDLSSHFPREMKGKCSICQEEYEADDEIGKLDCGHGYHINCIKQWLLQKNSCPVCKAAVAAEY